MKKSILGVAAILVLTLVSCTNQETTYPYYTTETTTITTTTEESASTVQSEEWARGCVTTYLYDMAKGPDAIRYLADLFSEIYTETQFHEPGMEYDGHIYSGWQVYFRPNGTPSNKNWENLNWAVFEDGFVTEGSNNALRVKADILELNESGSVSGRQPSPTTTMPPLETTTPAPSFDTTPSQVSGSSLYDGAQVEVSGQVFRTDSGSILLLDGYTGIELSGFTTGLYNGYHTITGTYNAEANTLNVTGAAEQNVFPDRVEYGKTTAGNLVPVSVFGLAATPPKEIADGIGDYLFVPGVPEGLTVYPYVVYAEDGLYLALYGSNIEFPAKFRLYDQGKDYSISFSSASATGTLLKTPTIDINLGNAWTPDEFQGILIADTITIPEPIVTTLRDITASPGYYRLQRVTIQGSYLITTATVDYSDIKTPMGQGVLADTFGDFFNNETGITLETIDPEASAWQLRECRVTGTVIYPTDQILKYLDYSAPMSPSEVKQYAKPALMVDTITDEVEQVADISELNPVFGNPSQYWGKVVEFEGYALGINYPLKEVAKAISNTDVPVNVNLLAIGIADNPSIGSQLAIIGLNNDLVGEQGEVIKGRYKFRVAVTQTPEQLASGVQGTDTAFFLLSKEELPMMTTTPPTNTTPPQTTTLPDLTQSWTVQASGSYLELKVTVYNTGTVSASGVYVFAGFDAGSNLLWNTRASPQFQVDTGATKTVTIYLEPPYQKYTRLVIQIVHGGYALSTSYSEWYYT